MDDKSFDRAKEIFFFYDGNFFHMSRDGNYKEYKTFDISNEQELIWKDELVEKWYNQLSFDDTLAFIKLAMIAENYRDYNIVEKLIAYISCNMNKGDSLIKLVYAEILLNIACPKELTKAKIDIVVNLLESVSNNQITINSSWLQKGFPELPDKEYITNRLKKDMDRVMDVKRMYC